MHSATQGLMEHVNRRRWLIPAIAFIAVILVITTIVVIMKNSDEHPAAAAVPQPSTQLSDNPPTPSDSPSPSVSPSVVASSPKNSATPTAQTQGGVGLRSGTLQKGKATNYVAGETGTGEGNCMFPAGTAGNKLFVALNPQDYAGAGGCGSYIDVTGPTGKSVRVLATDQCPECKPGHIDLSQTAFSQLADLRAGLISVSYKLVRDPAGVGPISIRVKEGSSQWWTSFLVIAHGNQLATVEYRDSAGVWKALKHETHNYWTVQKGGAGLGPYTLRVTDIYGNKTTMSGITLKPGVKQDTTARLY